MPWLPHLPAVFNPGPHPRRPAHAMASGQAECALPAPKARWRKQDLSGKCYLMGQLAALGEVIGTMAGSMQRESGIDLRNAVTVTSLGGRRQRPAAMAGNDPSERRAELVYHHL